MKWLSCFFLNHKIVPIVIKGKLKITSLSSSFLSFNQFTCCSRSFTDNAWNLSNQWWRIDIHAHLKILCGICTSDCIFTITHPPFFFINHQNFQFVSSTFVICITCYIGCWFCKTWSNILPVLLWNFCLKLLLLIKAWLELILFSSWWRWLLFLFFIFCFSNLRRLVVVVCCPTLVKIRFRVKISIKNCIHECYDVFLSHIKSLNAIVFESIFKDFTGFIHLYGSHRF